MSDADRVTLAILIDYVAETRKECEHEKSVNGTLELTTDELCLIEALLRAQPDPAPVDGWRPIETAPKDGNLFLMWLPGDDELGYVPTVHVGFRDSHGYINSAGTCAHMEDDIEPTAWMPLPPPPAEPSRDADGQEGRTS